ncbi:MAG: ribosome recycling factor [bacterium]
MEEYLKKFNKAIEYFIEQTSSLRTGRANPSIIEKISVDSYGAKMPLVQLATISTPEPRQLVIQPWDSSLTAEISKSIQSSPLGLQPQIEGNIIRINLPPLNEERRKELLKVLGQYEESAKISIKKIREETIRNWKKKQKDGDISEDELIINEKKLQVAIDEKHENLEEIYSKKEQEIMTV